MRQVCSDGLQFLIAFGPISIRHFWGRRLSRKPNRPFRDVVRREKTCS